MSDLDDISMDTVLSPLRTMPKRGLRVCGEDALEPKLVVALAQRNEATGSATVETAPPLPLEAQPY